MEREAPTGHGVQATQAGHGVQATQAGHGVQATQAGHGVQATQAGHGVQATQAGHGVQATQAGHGVQATQAAAAPVAEATVAMLRSLADPTRLRLFLAVRAKERCVSDLVASEGIAQPLVSHHLRVLSRAGLVQSRRSEGFTLYAVDPEGMAVARSAAMDLLDPGAVGPLGRPGDNTDCCR